MARNNNKESEPQNKQSLKTTLEGFAKRIDSFVQMSEDSPRARSGAVSMIGLLNKTFRQELSSFNKNSNKIKNVLKEEDLVNEQDPPEEIRLITDFNKRKNILKITYPFGQKYFLGFKENEKEEKIFIFVSGDESQQRIKSFKFRVSKEGGKFLSVKAKIYDKGKLVKKKDSC